MTDDDVRTKRLLQLEIAIATLSSDLRNHIVLCEARMKVLWKVAGGFSALIAAIVSVAISLART